ncbi:glycosyl hydrolase 115 family protein [Mucilaginibacter flavus]|uniref:glycosyl hydrolase 115 family protein n=1 Tax=Mucilaginibacter flavus TaxID=931504 RepID=UPI0025B390F8|nr:glycosyl hydrolase 115 family protein [Mucilaginibacter flavus]MDN3580731.1 glycosyl hydrolase 115 family protein [Mucilaginibacter flavus]
MKLYRALLIFLVSLILLNYSTYGQSPGQRRYVSAVAGSGFFPLAVPGKQVILYLDTDEYAGVKRAAANLITDIAAVTQSAPGKISTNFKGDKQMVLIGTIGKNSKIDRLIAEGKLDATAIKGKWEAHLTLVIKNPFPGVAQALVIAGSDKRGTIYGIYDLSAQIGVSPWYWWADVPVKHQKNIYVIPGNFTDGEPAVRYRGIFINDEAPAFQGWAKEKFGGVNHQVYEKVFELILRLKGNYLWPAMWGNAFNDDDKLNPVLADEYGIVMGTSHHEPMDRAQQEWKRYGTGAWNYQTNKTVLQEFWKQGIINMGNKETIVTVGMRGDGDMPMAEESNIALLENIVHDQREIISQVTGKAASQTPQMWALYKEVQDYYDKGMRVPDDVTLLLCDDNWGNIRKLPALGAKPRKGGYGIYFHFDYVGDPRNYKWLNTNEIAATWEQMHLAYEYNARQVWVVNVGDIKPMEYPISFFMDYAWAPDKWPATRLPDYAKAWAAQQFGSENAGKIAKILTQYTRFNSRRKPELLDQNTYSLVNYNEFERVTTDYVGLKNDAKDLYTKIPASYKDAYYQLVLHPVTACANLYELYFAAARNKLYAEQGRAASNSTAKRIQQLFERDKQISRYYNDTLSNSKWHHMMDQTHIGYTYWQQPEVDKMPPAKTISLAESANVGVTVEGSPEVYLPGQHLTSLPRFYPWNSKGHYIEIFNRGKTAFKYQLQSPVAYVQFSSAAGMVTEQERVMINIDWAKAPADISQIPVTVSTDAGKLVVDVNIDNEHLKDHKFRDIGGYIAIEAAHYTRAVADKQVNWQEIPDYGRTLSGVCPIPVTAAAYQPGNNSPHLEYQISLKDTGRINVIMYISPTLDFKAKKGLYYAVSIDDDAPQLVNINKNETPGSGEWGNSVANNIKKLQTTHVINKPGTHVLKYWMVDAGVVLQKVVIDSGGLKDSYLGPEEH